MLLRSVGTEECQGRRVVLQITQREERNQALKVPPEYVKIFEPFFFSTSVNKTNGNYRILFKSKSLLTPSTVPR